MNTVTIKEQLKQEIDHLDEDCLELLYRIVCQFPHTHPQQQENIGALFQKIADSGGLGIDDPQEWQRKIRKDRPLPL